MQKLNKEKSIRIFSKTYRKKNEFKREQQNRTQNRQKSSITDETWQKVKLESHTWPTPT